MKIVLDTSTMISATFWRGDSYKVVKMVSKGKVQTFTSMEVINEFKQVLQEKFVKDETKIKEIVTTMLNISKLIRPIKKYNAVKDDPEDNKVIDCAVEARADYLITKDKHILSLGEYKGIKIVTPREFLEIS
jgi:putative PIN family toxin of toxin-antitoxin system